MHLEVWTNFFYLQSLTKNVAAVFSVSAKDGESLGS